MSSKSARAYRILVCDDEPAVLRALSVALESHGYAVTPTATGEQAIAHAASEPPDVVLLDLGLPGIDGRETIRRLRTFLVDVPIIVLSAWGEDETKVEALDLGADDYIEKPFAMPELLARIRVAIRHLQRSSGASVESSRLERGDIVLDLLERRLFVRGVEVQATRTQFDLLATFARHPGRVLTHRALVERGRGATPTQPTPRTCACSSRSSAGSSSPIRGTRRGSRRRRVLATASCRAASRESRRDRARRRALGAHGDAQGVARVARLDACSSTSSGSSATRSTAARSWWSQRSARSSRGCRNG